MKLTPTITFEDATAALGAGLAEAEARGVKVSLAVVDAAGSLIAFARMDGARGYTAELAQQKARAAASVGVPTSLIARAQPQTTSAGGAPFRAAAECAGAVGVSGAAPEIDEAIALAGCGGVV